jgi:hypothetical protein
MPTQWFLHIQISPLVLSLRAYLSVSLLVDTKDFIISAEALARIRGDRLLKLYRPGSSSVRNTEVVHVAEARSSLDYSPPTVFRSPTGHESDI